MCEFCDGTEKPVEAGVCCDARFRIRHAPLGRFIMDVLDENDKWRCSLMVPHCPMCGRKREGDELTETIAAKYTAELRGMMEVDDD